MYSQLDPTAMFSQLDPYDMAYQHDECLRGSEESSNEGDDRFPSMQGSAQEEFRERSASTTSFHEHGRHRSVSSASGVTGVRKRTNTASSPSKPLLTMDFGEHAILEELDQHSSYGMLGEESETGAHPYGRHRSASALNRAPFQPIAAARQRKNSLLGSEGASEASAPEDIFEARAVAKRPPLRAAINKVIKTAQYLTPTFYYRMNIYVLVLFFVLMMVASRNAKPASKWLVLYFAAIGLEFSMSILDRMVFKLIDIVFYKYYDAAYLLHSINGPLGLLLTVLIMQEYFGYFEASEIFPDFGAFLSAFTVIIICLIVKNWFARQQYVYLLQRRFAEKLEMLETWTIVLSELASTRPPSAQRFMDSFTIPKEKGKRVKNVFADLVTDPDEGSIDEDALTRRDLYNSRKHFWKTASRLNASAGNMQLLTYNGPVYIKSQIQAKIFGKHLYKHLSKAGKILVNRELLKTLIEERRSKDARVSSASSTDGFPSHEAEAAKQAQLDRANTEEHVEESQELYEAALALFDPEGTDEISEDYCINAVLAVYKEQRFSAASIRDYGQLHQSLRIGIDILYWIFMTFVLQAFFGFVLTDYLLPFITLILSLSFSLAPLASNYLLAFAFVFFMAPFDIGHRVKIGTEVGAIEGWVKSITLNHTVITTMRMETVKVPNHVMFSARIFNFHETVGAVHEFIFCFNLTGRNTVDQAKVDEFFRRLKYYTLKTSGEWKTYLTIPGGMNSRDNSVEYRVYCTHRESWQFFLAAASARIQYLDFIKRLQRDMGLDFMKMIQPVHVVQPQDMHSQNPSEVPMARAENAEGGLGLGQSTPPIATRVGQPADAKEA